jgi:hypothetical protein
MPDNATSLVAGADSYRAQPEDIASHGAVVDAMLAAAGIAVTLEEREHLLELDEVFGPRMAALYALPEARYEAPALVFQADPKLRTWGA